MKKVSKKTILKRIKSGNPCCPVCGSRHTHSTGNMAEYPERWVEYYCNKCGQLVCISDNSPYRHICEDIHDKFNHLSYNKILDWIKKDVWLWGKVF